MAFDQTTRNRLQRFVSDARSLLADEFTQQLQAIYGMNPETGEVADIKTLSGLTPSQQETAHLLRDTLEHYLASTDKAKEKARQAAAIERIVREQAFTVLNRVAALRMSEAREFLIESLAKGYDSKGFQLFHRLAGSSLGETGEAYQHYLYSLFDEFSLDLAVLFDRFSVQGRLFPTTPVFLKLLDLINDEEIAPLWAEDETIGWIYQFWNGRDEIDKMRSASRAPRSSREMAVRNQFFTPRYVVEFLTDNTLGRIWYEMTQGKTGIVQSCKYLVRRPNEFFLAQDDTTPELEENLELSQEELLQQTVYIEHRASKDPRDIRMLDPACGSMHFGLYAFDLFEDIYSEAWDIEIAQGINGLQREHDKKPITTEYADKAAFLLDVPRLIIENNIHGVDIDPRATQIAGLSLWLRAHNSWQKAGVKPQQRPKIQRSNIVCAEPMPGEKALLQEFTANLKPTVLGQLVEVIFEKMELAGEAGTLLKIEQEIQDAIAEAKQAWQKQNEALMQFPDLANVAKKRGEIVFDISDIEDEGFWEQAEQKILEALADYAQNAAADISGQKRLFAEDAAKGFAFIELCRKRFDVVLMNPPFGMSSKSVDNYIKLNYLTRGDLISQFFERLAMMLLEDGRGGAISSRTVFYLSSQSTFREKVLSEQLFFNGFVDLGDGVLDAMVETALSIYEKKPSVNGQYFIRQLLTKDKEAELGIVCKDIASSVASKIGFIAQPKDFRKLSGSPICYWVSGVTVQKISVQDDIETSAADVRVGLQTGDDFRFLRLFWEVPNNYLYSGFPNADDQSIQDTRKKQKFTKRWAYYTKTDEAADWYSSINLVVDWKKDGDLLKANVIHKGYSPSKWVQSENQYFKPGFSYMLRSSRLVPYIVPRGCIPTAGRSQVFPVEGKEIDVLSICASNIGSAVARFKGEMFARPKFQAGMVQQLPYIDLPPKVKESVREQMSSSIVEAKRYYSSDETSIDFLGCHQIEIKTKPKTNFLSLLGEKNERMLAACFGLTQFEYDELQLDLQEAVSLRKPYEEESVEKQQKEAALKYLSYLIGCAFGRWDINFKKTSHELVDIYLELPLQSLAFKWQSGDKYIESKGIADIESANSIVKYIEGIYSKQSDNVVEAFSLAKINDWAIFLSKPTGFFDFHYSQYSQNRRYAPIYWLLQTTSGLYTLWVYYHKVTEQTLFLCVNDFVEPKLELIKEDLTTLTNKKSRSKDEEKEFGRLTDLKLELEDFRDELLRIAKFWKPNLNDGVQITAAPLWRLFQHKPWQKKLKQTWEKLEAGEYDWAHLACSIWPARVLKKCHQDRSLAIVHDVEEDLWHEVEVIKGRKKEPVWEWQPNHLSDTELNAYIQNKIQTEGLGE